MPLIDQIHSVLMNKNFWMFEIKHFIIEYFRKVKHYFILDLTKFSLKILIINLNERTSRDA